ncbi:MAG: hypothetical protein JSW55_06415 [Chloroflexota bacterium]|nr:MAG: hypothetical protein JSW55_06415 [Chloroflexota bacterium]
MPDPESPEQRPGSTRLRPPSFERRFIASETDDADTLVALASDESYFVRRQAVQNPNTPGWILDLLVKAGATADLRGRGAIDPDLDGDSLRRLVETGPWARQLVAEHPNTPAAVLAALKDQPSIPLRLAIAGHPNADGDTLAASCCNIEAGIRAAAAANPNCPSEVIEILRAAGARPDLAGVTRSFAPLTGEQLTRLADLGAWARFLAARHPDSPPDLLVNISSDPEWRVRSGLIDNPNTPDSLIEGALNAPVADDVSTIRCLSRTSIPAEIQVKLARYPDPEVRLALARHPAATPEMLGRLVSDGSKEIRRLAAGHPKTRAADAQLLVRAGSTPDLMGLSEPDPKMPAEEIETLLEGGVWARQLAVRHPNTDGDTMARLLCDREPKIREWAAVHPNLPAETKRDLIRAGSGTDLQGFMPPDPDLPPARLRQICALGSWGEWVVANNPYAPADLLETLAQSADPQIRRFVTLNPGTEDSSDP